MGKIRPENNMSNNKNLHIRSRTKNVASVSKIVTSPIMPAGVDPLDLPGKNPVASRH